MEVHAPSPFSITPFCYLEIPPLILWNPPLTYLEIPPLCPGANSRPLWSLVGCRPNPPRPPYSPFPLPTVPLLKCMPSYDDIAISASHGPIQ